MPSISTRTVGRIGIVDEKPFNSPPPVSASPSPTVSSTLDYPKGNPAFSRGVLPQSYMYDLQIIRQFPDKPTFRRGLSNVTSQITNLALQAFEAATKT